MSNYCGDIVPRSYCCHTQVHTVLLSQSWEYRHKYLDVVPVSAIARKLTASQHIGFKHKHGRTVIRWIYSLPYILYVSQSEWLWYPYLINKCRQNKGTDQINRKPMKSRQIRPRNKFFFLVVCIAFLKMLIIFCGERNEKLLSTATRRICITKETVDDLMIYTNN